MNRKNFLSLLAGYYDNFIKKYNFATSQRYVIQAWTLFAKKVKIKKYE